jgi:hypothetical protein
MKEDKKDFDAKNMMMTVKYWPDGPEEESGEPQFITDVTSIKRDPKTGEFVIGTIFDDIRIPYKKFETVIEVS